MQAIVPVTLRLGAPLLVALTLIGVSAAVFPAAAQTPLALETWLDWERVSDPRISPDGSQVVYTHGWVDRMNDSWESSIRIVNSDGSRPRELIAGSSPRWSPTGDRIAFLAPDDEGNTQIFIRWMDAEGAVSPVTRLTEAPSDIAWSPDGTQLSFTMSVPAENPSSRHWQVSLPRPEGADWTPGPRIIESLVYRQDRVGFLDETFRHIFVVPAGGGTPRQLTRGDHNYGAPVWEPSGETLLFSGLIEDDALYRWQESEVYRLGVDSGDLRQVTTRKGPDGAPAPSADGRMIAYVGHDTTTFDYIESTLYVMNADGSNPRALTTELDRTPRGLQWAPDGSGVYFNVQADGYANIMYASVDGEVRPASEGPQMFSLADVSAGGMAVGTWGDAHEPGDIYAFPVDRALPLGGPERAHPALPDHVRRQRDHTHHAHDRRTRPPHPDVADGTVLPGAQGAEQAHGDAALPGGMARHVPVAVELHPHPTVPAEVVRALGHARRPACGDGRVRALLSTSNRVL